MINMLTGYPGAGKTYALARKALQFAEQGRELYCNFELNTTKSSNLKKYANGLFYPYQKQIHYQETVDELLGLNKGVIIMDEAQVYFNSRSWADADIRLQYKLQQHRKDGLDIWGTVQHEKRLDAVMCELVTKYYQCKKFFGLREGAKHVFGWIRIAVFYPEDVEKVGRKKIFSEWMLIRREFVDSYDTNKKIELKEEHRLLKHKVYYCPVYEKKEIKHGHV